MEQKQTAVEWLIKQLDIKLDGWNNEVIKQAKIMEQQHIEDAFNAGRINGTAESDYCDLFPEQYYNETFKSE